MVNSSNAPDQDGVVETRVEDLITDYMEHYKVDFQRAIDMMIEDLNAARENPSYYTE